MTRLQKTFVFWGRVSIGSLFIFLATDKILNWQVSEKELFKMLGNWQGSLIDIGVLQDVFSFLLDWVPATMLILLILEILGGFLLFFNIKPKFGVFLLIITLLFSTFVYYPFWFVGIMDKDVKMHMFFMNIGVFGGLLLLLSNGKSKKISLPLPMKSPKLDNSSFKK